MPSILDQRAARAVMKLPFCYVCGREFASGESTNRDHIPPQSAFPPEDRKNFPLLLPTHTGCNHIFNLEDELLCQLVALAHSREEQDTPKRLEIDAGFDREGRTYTLLTNVNLHEIIRRWVRAFHASLYQETISAVARFSIQTPLPSGSIVGNAVQVDPPRPQFKLFAERIALNSQLGLTDQIVTNNGRMRYLCTWQRANNGQWFAMFRIDLYAWNSFGDRTNFDPRECVGSYIIPNHYPVLATLGTELDLSRA